MTILLSFMIFIGFSFMYMSHPLTMGLMIIFQTFLICMFIGSYSMNFWYSYILFLVFLGGMLVLFLYISSLAENELFMYQNKWLFKSYYLCLMLLILMINYLFEFNTNLYTIDSSKMMKMMNWKLHSLTTYFYSPLAWKITIFLGLYLLFCLLVVTKICQLNKGPMRQKF